MATTRQWLNLPYGHNGNALGACEMSFGLLKYCPCNKVETLHVLLPAFCIAHSLRLPISGGILISSG
jgi:hypothetical protein